jgi:hypothetical protein
MLRLNRFALTGCLAICGTAGAVFANPNSPVIKPPPQSSPNSPEMKIPAQPTLNPDVIKFIKQDVFAELGHGPARADQSILLSASLKNKDGTPTPKGFKIKLSAGSYSCDAEVGNVAGFASCDVKIPFAVPTSNGGKSINVGNFFELKATIPPEIGNLTITSTRKFRLLSKEGYGLHRIPSQGVNGTVLPVLNSYTPLGILFNNYKGGSNPLLKNGSWLYLDKKDATKAENFHYPMITVTDKFGVNLLHADFYTNRVYVQPTQVSINNANGTFNLGFTMSGFDGSGPSIVGRCREIFCPNSAVPDFKNLRFDEASASYKLTVKNGKLRVNLVDSKVKLNFDCNGGFTVFCSGFRKLVNEEMPNQFKIHLKNPVLLAQIEKSVSDFLGGILALKDDFDGTLADFQICPPNSPNCNEGDILVFYVPKGQ